jgi:diamine N-acetyltransferase
MRAICNDGKPVGFMMTSERPSSGEYFLWRMMIDKNHQGAGYGGAAMRLLIDRIRDNGNPKVLLLSHLKNNVEAGSFYRGCGFSYTGNDLGGGDLEMSLRFDRALT